MELGRFPNFNSNQREKLSNLSECQVQVQSQVQVLVASGFWKYLAYVGMCDMMICM